MVSILVGLGLSALGLTGSAVVAYTYVKVADYVASKVDDIEFRDYTVEHKSLKPGDHIFVSGAVSPMVKEATNKASYYHHMIYLGDGKIAEFGCENSKYYPVIENMRQHNKIYKREYKKCISTEETIALCKRFDRCLDYGYKYNFVYWNCEHFATMVKTKQYKSPQVSRWEIILEPIVKRIVYEPTCSRLLAYVPQPLQPKKIEQSGHDLFIATAKWITKGRFFAGARAGIADIQPPPESTGNLTTASKVCTVGADAQVDTKYSGVGVEATLVSVNVDAGNFAGLRLGISGDSSIGLGTEKTSVKIAGTGFTMNATGTEITILGTGIKLGSWVTVYGWREKLEKLKR